MSLDELCDVPVPVVTCTSTWPDECDGATAAMVVGELTVKLDAAVPPNVTPVTFVKPVPVIVIVSPPEIVSVPGETLVTVGAGD